MARLARVFGRVENRNRHPSEQGRRLESPLGGGLGDDTEIGLASQPLRIIFTHLGLGSVEMEARHA